MRADARHSMRVGARAPLAVGRCGCAETTPPPHPLPCASHLSSASHPPSLTSIWFVSSSRTLPRHAPPISHLRHFTSHFIVRMSSSPTSTPASSHSHIAARVTLTSHLNSTSRHPPSDHINNVSHCGTSTHMHHIHHHMVHCHSHPHVRAVLAMPTRSPWLWLRAAAFGPPVGT